MADHDPPLPKPVHWVGSSREDLRKFPDEVQREIGQALWFAQMGDKRSIQTTKAERFRDTK